MKLMVHKTDNTLAVLFDQPDLVTNAHRCREYFQALQSGALQGQLAEEGVVSAQVGQHGQGAVMLLTFSDKERIKEWCLARRAYTMEEYVGLCQQFGKDPNELIAQAQQTGQTMFFQF